MIASIYFRIKLFFYKEEREAGEQTLTVIGKTHEKIRKEARGL